MPHSGSTYSLNKQENKNSAAFIPVPSDDNDYITIRVPDKSGCIVHEHHLYTHHQVSRLIDR